MDEQLVRPDNKMDADAQFLALETKIRESCHGMDLGRIRAAYEMARIAHSGQLRRDGSPYVTHCIAAADIAVDMGLDEDSIISALLHDLIEDTNLTHGDIARQFGEPVADIVEGVTKLTRVQYTSKEDEQMENLRKMLMAMAKDIRVILIKIADRLHNMRTMAYQTAEKQRAKSLETMEIYAPIAHRLGMQRAKWELEDLSLQYLDPTGYKEITDSLNARMDELESFMSSMEEKIQTRLKSEGVEATIYCRIKHVYSIYRKMYAQKLDINGIFDLCAFRVIVDSIPDCYNVLGIIHDMFKPVPGRFKDYISTPKPNMYQSVHTTVIGSEGIPFEVQIRTWEMHHTAEYGVAAHWKYKLGENGSGVIRSGDEDKFGWVRRLLESQQESDAQDFFHNLKIDMFADEVFVFSPKGDVINLPAGATPIDFAYSIHSDVGNHMVGAKVNGRIVTYDYALQNGDIVEIRTSKSAPGPSRDWLNTAKSGSARTKIKQWFKKERREENVIRGREMLEDELKRNGVSLEEAADEENLAPILKRLSFTNVEDMYAAIGYGGVTATRVANRLRDEIRVKPDRKTALEKVSEAAERREQQAVKEGKSVHGILVEGISNCLVKFSRCCTPVPGDDIVGFITRGQGVSIHRRDCANCQSLLRQPENEGRWVPVSWASAITDSYVTTLSITAKDRAGLVMDIATVLNALNAKVRSLAARDIGSGTALTSVSLEVKNAGELKYIMGRLQSIPGVSAVARNSR